MTEELRINDLEGTSDAPIGSGSEMVELIEAKDHQDTEKLHEKLLAYFKEYLEKTEPWREEAEIDRAFYEGKQWTDKEKQQFEAQQRVPVTINEIEPTIEVITGMESRNRLEIKVLPRNDNDVDAANSRTALIKYVADQNDLEFKTAQAFLSALTYAFGVLHTTISDEPGKEPISVEVISPDEFCVDPYHKKPDLTDAEYAGFYKKVAVQKLVDAFPEFKEKLEHETETAWDEYKNVHQHHRRAGDQFKDFYDFGKSNQQQKPTRRQLTVIELYYRVMEPGYVLLDEYGDQTVIDEALISDEEIVAKLQTDEVRIIEKRISKIRRAIFTHENFLLDEPVDFRHRQLPFVVIWSKKYHTGEPVSPIRSLRDPHREVNRRKASSLLELIANQWILRGTTNESIDKLKKDLGNPFALIKEPIGTRLERVERAAASQLHFNQMKESQNMIRQLSRANDQIRGLAGQYQSGLAIGMKQQQGTTVIARFFDNLRRARKQLGYQLLSLVEQYMPLKKKIRIAEKEGITDNWRFENKLHLFDLVVDEQNMLATDRQTQLSMLTQLMQSLPPEAQSQLLPIIAGYFDVKDKDKLVQAAQRVADVMIGNLELQKMQAQMGIAQMQQQMQQAEVQSQMAAQSQEQQGQANQQAQVQQAQQADQQAQAAQAQADQKQAEQQQKVQLAQAQAQMNQEQADRRLQLEQIKADRQFQLEEAKLQLEREKMIQAGREREAEGGPRESAELTAIRQYLAENGRSDLASLDASILIPFLQQAQII